MLSVEAGALLELVMHGPSAASQLLPRMRDRFPACDALTLDTWLDELAAVRLIAPAPCN